MRSDPAPGTPYWMPVHISSSPQFRSFTLLVMLSLVPGATRSGVRLQTKFVLAVTVLTLLLAITVLLILQFALRRAVSAQTQQGASAIANTIESTAGYYVVFGLTDDLKAIVADLRKNRSIEYADFIAPDGSVIAATDPAKKPAVFARPPATREADMEVKEGEQSLFVSIRPFFETRAEEADPTAKPSGYFRLATNDQQSVEATRQLRSVYLLVLVVAILMGIMLAVIAARFIVRPLLHIASIATEIARGDLTKRTDYTSTDELGTLATEFNQMTVAMEKTVSRFVGAGAQLASVSETVESRATGVISLADEQRGALEQASQSVDELNRGIQKISENVELLSASSEETSSSILEMVASMEEVSRHTDTLFASVEETSSATEQMVSSINEVDQNMDFLRSFVTDTSASMTEMSASISQVEANAARSYELALGVADAAEQGMRAVRETMEGMEQIRHSVLESNHVLSRLGDRSNEIGKIVTVIEDVAEQTNLLALNAAILAAQAGEHGKGFSVVASQIRDLSERTASSTKEIGNLIGAVREEVQNAVGSMAQGSKLAEQGVALAHDAGKALNNILESSSKSSEMGKEIASATRDQARGSEAVAHSVDRLQEMVNQINSATGQQAAGSEHIRRAVESMREVTRYVRQAMAEQKSGSVMISRAAERMIDMVHEIFGVTANQAAESQKIVETMDRVRSIADSNRQSANEMSESVSLLRGAVRSLDEEFGRFRVGK